MTTKAKTTVGARARALWVRMDRELQEATGRYLPGTPHPDDLVAIIEFLNAERLLALEEAIAAIKAERLHDPNPDSEGDQGYSAGIEDACGAIEVRKAKP